MSPSLSSSSSCSYFLCGRSTRYTQGIRQFTFPINDKARCQKWLANSGNPDLANLCPKKLKKCFLCEHHFHKKDFMTKGLCKSAVPIKYNFVSERHKKQRTFDKRFISDSVLSTYSTPDHSTVRQTSKSISSNYNAKSPEETTSSSLGSNNISNTDTLKCTELGHEIGNLCFTSDKLQKQLSGKDESPLFSIHPKSKVMRTACSYYLCGRSIRLAQGIRQFTFPVKDIARCQQWLDNSGNPELAKLSPEKLKKLFLCEQHFHKNDFLTKSLSKTAVPIKYNSISEVHKVDRQRTFEKRFACEPVPSTSSTLDICALSQTPKSLKLEQKNESFDTHEFLKRDGEVSSSPSTESKRLKGPDCIPGDNNTLLQSLKQKIETMSENERQCIVVFDEVSIKQFFNYSKENYSTDIEDSVQSSNSDDQTIILTVRGVESSWKIPLKYSFNHKNVKVEGLQTILGKIMRSLRFVKLNPIAVVYDQASDNQ